MMKTRKVYADDFEMIYERDQKRRRHIQSSRASVLDEPISEDVESNLSEHYTSDGSASSFSLYRRHSKKKGSILMSDRSEPDGEAGPRICESFPDPIQEEEDENPLDSQMLSNEAIKALKKRK